MTGADPWQRVNAALDQVQAQLAALGAQDLDRPTPCADFDAGTMAAHVVAVVRRLTAVGRGGSMLDVADPVDDVTDDWAGVFAAARAVWDETWASDEAARRTYTLPWATSTGTDIFDAYAAEFAVHSWDLACVTGDVDSLDPALADAALRWYERYVPAEGREAMGAFGPVVQVPADAGRYERLAGYVGRAV